jgi:hypothetical protein
MSDSINVNVLVSAKDEYTNILKTLIGPLIHSGFEHMYNDAVRIEPRYTLRKFQEFCKETQRWNQFMIDNEVAKVKEQYDWIYDLITAIFVINVKILTSIRLGGDSKNINIKMPSLEKFIHKVYISSAERFYVNPKLFKYIEVDTDNNIYNKKENCLKIIEIAIDNAIKDLLPVQYILQEYLAKVMDESEKDSNDGSENESEQSEQSEQNEQNEKGEQDDQDDQDEQDEQDEQDDQDDQDEQKNNENSVVEKDGKDSHEICSNLDSDSENDDKPVNKFGSQFRNDQVNINPYIQERSTVNQMHQPVNQPVNQAVNQPVNQQVNQTHHPVNQTHLEIPQSFGQNVVNSQMNPSNSLTVQPPTFSNFSINPAPNSFF